MTITVTGTDIGPNELEIVNTVPPRVTVVPVTAIGTPATKTCTVFVKLLPVTLNVLAPVVVERIEIPFTVGPKAQISGQILGQILGQGKQGMKNGEH